MVDIVDDLEKQKIEADLKKQLKKAKHCDCPKCWWNFGWVKVRKPTKKIGYVIAGVLVLIGLALFLL